jgi:hypothetical protein
LQPRGIQQIAGIVEDGATRIHVRLLGGDAAVLETIQLLPGLAKVIRLSDYDFVVKKRKSPLDSEL